MKDPGSYDIEEVCLFINAIGLGKTVDAFREAGVDGDILVSLSPEEFESELGLSKLQAKKVVKSIESTKAMAAGGGGGNTAALESEIANLKNENAALRAQLQEYQRARAPAPAPAPAYKAPPPTAPSQAPPPRNEHHVVKGAAGGAARGALLGAVAGAVAGDAGKGAKIGAAVGATSGGLNGLGARRRARLRGR